MNIRYRRGVVVCILLCSASLLSQAVFAQGSLTPPGPPAPSMKTLDQIEARIPVNDVTCSGTFSAVYTISKSGSYYLTGDVNGAAAPYGVYINSSYVTLDLNGYSVIGESGSGFGILVGGLGSSVRNGVVRGWGTAGIYGSSADGLILENIQAQGNSGVGGGMSVGSGGIVRNCVASQNNGGNGIGAGLGATVISCSSSSNGSNGIAAGTGGSVIDCTVYGNDAAGIIVNLYGTVSHATVYSNVTGIDVGYGSQVIDCQSGSNDGDGIVVSSNCIVRNNICDQNGIGVNDGAGIHATSSGNRIEGNNVTRSDRGYDVDVAGNFIASNTAHANTTNFALTGTQTVGPIINVSGTITTTIPTANFSF